MLSHSVNRYITLRRRFGYKLVQLNRLLLAFASFAEERGDTHICKSTALAWATSASTTGTRYVRLRAVAMFAGFLHAENQRHELIPDQVFPCPKGRLMPYIYSPEEIVRLTSAAKRLPLTYPLRRQTYATMFGLIASTGMRISEALSLKVTDVCKDGLLQIRHGKGGKARVIPLHKSTVAALKSYLSLRCMVATKNYHLFLSAHRRQISRNMAAYTFRRLTLLAGITETGTRPCRIHDLRHTFATRSLEQCRTDRRSVAAHFVALATYLGHADIAHTYWYLEATPELMTDISAAAEILVGGEAA
jgi:integrase/recombinase XerD